jgi:hypothetical protein
MREFGHGFLIGGYGVPPYVTVPIISAIVILVVCPFLLYSTSFKDAAPPAPTFICIGCPGVTLMVLVMNPPEPPPPPPHCGLSLHEYPPDPPPPAISISKLVTPDGTVNGA